MDLVYILADILTYLSKHTFKYTHSCMWIWLFGFNVAKWYCTINPDLICSPLRMWYGLVHTICTSSLLLRASHAIQLPHVRSFILEKDNEYTPSVALIINNVTVSMLEHILLISENAEFPELENPGGASQSPEAYRNLISWDTVICFWEWLSVQYLLMQCTSVTVHSSQYQVLPSEFLHFDGCQLIFSLFP